MGNAVYYDVLESEDPGPDSETINETSASSDAAEGETRVSARKRRQGRRLSD